MEFSVYFPGLYGVFRPVRLVTAFSRAFGAPLLLFLLFFFLFFFFVAPVVVFAASKAHWFTAFVCPFAFTCFFVLSVFAFLATSLSFNLASCVLRLPLFDANGEANVLLAGTLPLVSF
jgi:hypothetical protein